MSINYESSRTNVSITRAGNDCETTLPYVPFTEAAFERLKWKLLEAENRRESWFDHDPLILIPDTWRVTLPQFSAIMKWLPSDMKARLTLYGIPCTIVSPIKKVIFNDPATIVFWEDGDKTVVKCQEGDTFSKETGLAMAIAKKALGNKGRFNETFKQWIPEYGKSDD